MPLISRPEAAAALGVTVDAVYKAIKAGRLTAVTAADGTVRVNSETMREEWIRNTDSTRVRIGLGVRPTRTREPKPLRPREERMPKPQTRITQTQEAIPDYDESRARTEHLKAELLELDRKTKEGRLIPLEEVQSKWVEVVVQARTKLLGIPTKAKQRIPDLDVDAINILDDLVREALEDLSETAPEDDQL
jgi:hypothetical protein